MASKRRHSNETSPHIKRSKGHDFDDVDAAPQSDVYREPWRALAGWFLGPRAENREEFNRLVQKTLQWVEDCREGYYPCDPCYITEKTRSSKAFRSEIEDTEEQLEWIQKQLAESVPFFSPRYKGHMTWETTMPSILGYIAGMMWNQNNVDASASPVTTQFELSIGKHLCQMMGFPEGKKATNVGEKEVPAPWAHLTGCGSVANLESLWAARNLKFHPLAVKSAVMDPAAEEIHGGQNFEVYVPGRGHKIALKDCTQWELLNLDVDDICNMADGVAAAAGVHMDVLDVWIQKYSVINVGMANFVIQQGITKTPVFCSPGTNHYSWPKSATVLGLGGDNLIPIHVDKQCRMDLNYLEKKLQHCLEQQIPLLTTVCVIGSTEESAVDPISTVVKLRNEYRKKGLNFTIHADAAWGGYLLTMIRKPDEERMKMFKSRGEDFVPNMALSDYVTAQYQAVQYADTVTIDPHKAGYCLYPAGALAYRNGSMRGFITLKAPEVFHGEGDMEKSVGVFGLEGSKPGAAAAGVLLSHRVIGLDQLGYGRILGQCTFGTKLFYCMWMTIAQQHDDWFCENFIDMPQNLPGDMPREEAIQLIKTEILGVDNVKLFKNKKAMNLLKAIGPDALINTFVVNIKGNKDIEVCNKLQDLIFSELTGKVGEPSKRVPMFLTTSSFEKEKYGASYEQLRERLELHETDKNLHFLRNTVMNPFQTSEEVVTHLGKLFRNTVLNCVAELDAPYGEERVNHSFIAVNRMNKDGVMFLEYMPEFGTASKRYHIVATFEMPESDDMQSFREMQRRDRSSNFFFRFKKKMTMYKLLREDTKKDLGAVADLFIGKAPSAFDRPAAQMNLRVKEVFRYNHLEKPSLGSDHVQYPANMTYYMYGDEKKAYMSHVMDYYPSFHQIIELDEIPFGFNFELLDTGIEVQIEGMQGRPKDSMHGGIVDPLEAPNYTIHYKGKQAAQCKTLVRLAQHNAKVWFESSKLNQLNVMEL